MFEDFGWEDEEPRESDPVETSARETLRQFFDQNPQQVFFSRQLEVQNEGHYFHWITNRAIRDLEAEGAILSETRPLLSGGTIKLLWHRRFRYYRRDAARLVQLVNEYSAPNIGAALGLQAEALVLEGFASIEFVMKGRDKNDYVANRGQTLSTMWISFSSAMEKRTELRLKTLSVIWTGQSSKQKFGFAAELEYGRCLRPVCFLRLGLKT
jgi:hypothetical protein